jgi:hypothetical protein
MNRLSEEGFPGRKILRKLSDKQWGYDLIGSLKLLFKNEGEYRKVRYPIWRKGVALAEGMFILHEIEKWCRSNTLFFSGHLLGEGTASVHNI